MLALGDNILSRRQGKDVGPEGSWDGEFAKQSEK